MLVQKYVDNSVRLCVRLPDGGKSKYADLLLILTTGENTIWLLVLKTN